MPHPKIYTAQAEAFDKLNIKPLIGTRASAQRYVNRITATDWWLDVCPSIEDLESKSFPTQRVWVWEDKTNTVVGVYELGSVTTLGKLAMHSITIGSDMLSYRWVLLHELAHVLTSDLRTDGYHGPVFCFYYLALVGKFLGLRAFDILREECETLKIRRPKGLRWEDALD